MKKHISTEEIKKYNAAFTEFMKPSEEETGGEENKFRMPPLPLLTLNGVQKPAKDNETTQEKNYENCRKSRV